MQGAVGAVLAVVRLVLGPTVADRVVASDVLLTLFALGTLLASARTGTGTYLVAGLVVALLGFVGTASVARFLEVGGDGVEVAARDGAPAPGVPASSVPTASSPPGPRPAAEAFDAATPADADDAAGEDDPADADDANDADDADDAAGEDDR